jgi:hypothetical protein
MTNTLHVLTDCSFNNSLEDTELETLQDAVGGLIQAVDLTPSLTMWCNEEGKLIGLPVNPVATAMWTRYFGETDIIVGNVVFTGGCDEEGNTTSILQDDADKIEKLCSTYVSALEGGFKVVEL